MGSSPQLIQRRVHVEKELLVKFCWVKTFMRGERRVPEGEAELKYDGFCTDHAHTHSQEHRVAERSTTVYS